VERVEGLGAVLDLSNFTAFKLFFDEAFARFFFFEKRSSLKHALSLAT
jgi:hypothetical protein